MSDGLYYSPTVDPDDLLTLLADANANALRARLAAADEELDRLTAALARAAAAEARAGLTGTVQRGRWLTTEQVATVLGAMQTAQAEHSSSGYPHHAHQVPGVWDNDGTPCEECHQWQAALAALGGEER